MANLTDFFSSKGDTASIINEVIFIKDTVDVLTTADDRVYLKGGVYETDLTLYPDASTTDIYAGNNFSFATQTTYVNGMCSDGTHLYLVNQNEDKVYKYTNAGVYVAVYDTTGTSTPYAIEWDGTSFWIGDNYQDVRQYDTSFNLIGSTIDLAAQLNTDGIKGIAWDGTHFYVLTYSRTVFKYSSSWVYTSVAFGSGGQTGYVDGITSDGTHIYVYRGYSTWSVAKWDSAGNYIGVAYSIPSGEGGYNGTLAWDGTNFRIADPSTDLVIKIEPAIGIDNYTYGYSGVGQVGEGQNYVRVK